MQLLLRTSSGSLDALHSGCDVGGIASLVFTDVPETEKEGSYDGEYHSD